LKKKYYILLFWIFSIVNISAQEISINANNKALNEVLIEIRDRYVLNLSFNDRELSKYKITVKRKFASPEAAFGYLFEDLPIDYEKSGNVYLFFPKKNNLLAKKSYQISVKVFDSESMESLPFTHVLINGIGSITDEYGNFNFGSRTDSIFQLKILHLGYHVVDTVLIPGLNYQINLTAMMVDIDEVLVEGNPIVFSEQTGTRAGLMRINHKIAKFIPGNGDNSVFNLLRLQPGILAAGEQSSEMIIWGSYEGQSQVNFDGITLFGLKNYNDNISTVNPYMAKDIRINKGGFDATMGERVGGIVDISGTEGNKQNAGMNLNINNMTMNFLGETPLGSNASLVGAFRQTYYNLYSAEDIGIGEQSNSHMEGNNVVVKPNYVFRDGNLKFSGQNKGADSYSFSSLFGQDHFSYNIVEEIDEMYYNAVFSQELVEKQQQYGASAVYNKVWEGMGSSELSIAYSNLQSETYDKQNSTGMYMNNNMHSKEERTHNDITELKAKLSNKIRLSPRHEIEFAGGYISNYTLLQEESLSSNPVNISGSGSQLMAYLQDRYTPGEKLLFTIGLRNDFSLNLKKNYLQPRLSMAIKPSEKLQFNLSWGLYNQFVVLNSDVDENNNYRYLWTVADNLQIPVLSAQHFVLGGVFNKNGFSASIESFYKETDGITRLVTSDARREIYIGKSKAMGIDFFVKQEYKGHSFWVSYSLSQSLEWFPYFTGMAYQPALQDQLHEIKFAGIVKLSAFYISANYIYGSGFSQNSELTNNTQYPYSRMDIAGIYRFSLKKVKIETGLSFLNVFNRENIKYSNLIQVPTDSENTVGVYSGAVPFTPSLFLNISF